MNAAKFEWKSEQQRVAVRLFIKHLLLAHNNDLMCKSVWYAVTQQLFLVGPYSVQASTSTTDPAFPSYYQIRRLWRLERDAIKELAAKRRSYYGPFTPLTEERLDVKAAQQRFRRVEALMRRDDWPPMKLSSNSSIHEHALTAVTGQRREEVDDIAVPKDGQLNHYELRESPST